MVNQYLMRNICLTAQKVKCHLKIVLLIVGEVVIIPSKAKILLICVNVHLPSHWVQRATILPL